MIQVSTSGRRGRGLRGVGRALSLIVLGACADADHVGPTETPLAETPAAETPALATAAPTGVMFGSFGLVPSQLNTVHTGIVRANSPSDLLTYLAQVKAKGGRVLVKFSGGDNLIRNDDGTFSLTKWKSRIARFRNVNFTSYINDGTIVGHYIIDEPHFADRWGDHVIPQATVEEAAKYSKQLWPTMPTIVNAPANWLAATTTTYTGLDAAWAMYRSTTHNSAATWAGIQVNKARSKGLGLFAGLNVLDGGDGSSGFRGNLPRKWAMSAAEIRSYGTALLAQSYVCGFAMWSYKSSYYDRADMKSAMADVSALAKKHAKTSCRQ